ncbi:MAG TPA: tetratricopeptide repeat protein [Lapillicoccus sp.]|nr:tetratricopeptide repeat protein [Lapillicoccus sp.]
MSDLVEVREVRVLDGPNLYFARPAVKVSLRLPGYLALERRYASELAERCGLRSPRPGKPNTAQRQRFVMRLAAHVMRRVVAGVGPKRITVRTRPGGTVDDIVVAIPWRHRNWGRLAGEALAPVLEALLGDAGTHTESVDRTLADAAARIRGEEPGGPSSVRSASVPVVSITGTNGKTTTTRLVAHLAMTAGKKTAWSSTSGVVVMGETVDEGDFSGPAGAREVLATPGLEIGVLETARGGMLLRGMGVAANDVSVVTNVTADHLGQQGIETLDQLAEVKGIVTTVTKPDGWVVLNGEDPRVWAMRHRIQARPWAFSVDPDAPALRESITAGGRGITVLDGDIVVLTPGADPDRLVRIVDVPVTLSGLSRHNTANALAATAAALGLGLSRSAVVEGLRTFAPDPVLNEGRLNTYTLPLEDGGRATVILDLAHNEAGLEALLQVARGLTAPGARVHLALGGTGDRSDEAIQALGEMAGKGADHVVVAHKPKYLRGRTLAEVDQHLRTGLARVGIGEVESYDTEMEGLLAVVPTLGDGDVLAFMCHDSQAAIRVWLADHGGTVDDPRTIRRKVVAARGEHELESEIAELCAMTDDAARIAAAERLVSEHPSDERLVFELAGAYDAAGDPARAIGLYRSALAAGLREPYRHRAQIQAASTLRNLGDHDGALRLLDDVDVTHPGNVAAAAFRALTLADAGRSGDAVADLVDALVDRAADEDAVAYRRSLKRYAAQLRAGCGDPGSPV